MVSARRAEEVIDPSLEVKPSTRELKRALLVALKCLDPAAEKRPKMSHVVRMFEADDNPFREVSIDISYPPFMNVFVCQRSGNREVWKLSKK